MIRFMFGLILVIGAVGGLEQNTASWTQFFIASAIGFALMIWALPKLVERD